MIKLKTTRINFNTLITKKGDLDKMNEAYNLINYIESKYSSKILDSYSLGVSRIKDSNIRGFIRYYSLSSIIELIATYTENDIEITETETDKIDINIINNGKVTKYQSNFYSEDSSKTLKSFCDTIWVYLTLINKLKENVEVLNFKEFCIKCGLRNPNINVQCTAYYDLKYMLEHNIKPVTKEEFKRWENNPTEYERINIPNKKYLIFLHPNLRDLFIDNWDKLKL